MTIMDTPYNLTALTDATTVSSMAVVANNIVDQILFGIFMLAIFFVMLMALKRYDFDNALLSSSFVCFILSMLLLFGGLINFMFPLLFLTISAFTAFYMYIAS